ncbi:MAG TPA: site-specific integrase, partial [bacterium]|nr:site-specific integrase [bacterium]
MEDTLNKFLDYLAHQKNYSGNTVAAYRMDILSFFSYLHNIKILSLADVDYQVFMGFLSCLRERKLADSTVARKVASLKAFFKFLFTRKLINANP